MCKSGVRTARVSGVKMARREEGKEFDNLNVQTPNSVHRFPPPSAILVVLEHLLGLSSCGGRVREGWRQAGRDRQLFTRYFTSTTRSDVEPSPVVLSYDVKRYAIRAVVRSRYCS